MNKAEWRAWLDQQQKAEKGKGEFPPALAHADVNDLFMHAEEQAAQYAQAQKELRPLVEGVTAALKILDRAMKQPDTRQRGEMLGRMAGELEMLKDSARFFGLGIDYRTGKPRVRVKRLQGRASAPRAQPEAGG